MTRSEEVLKAAFDLVGNDRRRQWGDPIVSLDRIAKMWSAILGPDIKAHEVALCMAALKIARATHNPEAIDSWVDIAGYAGIGSESVV